jgi:hypothetical protein
LVALLADAGSFAKPVLVFAPGSGQVSPDRQEN